MKKQLFSLVLILSFLISYSQNWPENNPELLLNRTVKPKIISDGLQEYAYKNFYLEYDPEKKEIVNEKNKPFTTGPTYSLKSDYNKLVGKEFKVIGVYDISSKYESISGKEYALEMENPEIGKVYYKYSVKYEHNFELEVIGGLIYPVDFFCSKITIDQDKFDKKASYYSPTEDGINFMKVVENGKKTIYLSVTVNGSTLNVNVKGLFVLFEDGTKFIKQLAKIDVEASRNDGYDYSAFVTLNPTEVKTFSSKNITDVKLYIYDSSIDLDSAKKAKEYLKCLNK